MQENDNTKRRGRKKKNSGKETQHVLYMEPDLWDAAEGLPISRQDIARDAFRNAIAYYKSDLPKLKWQLDEVRKRIQKDLAEEATLVKLIEGLEEKVVIESNEAQEAENKIEVAIKETLTMCKAFKRNMAHGHYAKLSELSGTEAAKIEVFLKDSKFRPTEDAVRVFYRG